MIDGSFSAYGVSPSAKMLNFCNIWYGNQASWIGKVGLLYPSDYGYSASPSYWNSNMNTYYQNNITEESWILNTDAFYNWFLSPASDRVETTMNWNSIGESGDYCYGFGSLRPALHIKSDTVILSGEGSITDPFIIN